MSRSHKVTVLLNDEELAKLQAAANQVRVDVSLYLRSSALNAARDVTSTERPTYSREQLMSIQRRAALKGHKWIEEELRQRGLPLYWCEEWVRARLAQGYTRAQLAVESGHPERSVTNYLRRVYGMQEFRTLTQRSHEYVREQVAAGRSRDELAAELGISIHTVATYARAELSIQERQFLDITRPITEWPVSIDAIAAASFDGDLRRASAWCRLKVNRGWLRRVKKGWYELGSFTPPLQTGVPK